MADEDVNRLVARLVPNIPDYKFVGLLYQLCARLVTKAVKDVHEPAFPGILKSLIFRYIVYFINMDSFGSRAAGRPSFFRKKIRIFRKILFFEFFEKWLRKIRKKIT
jgi:hypothetical protein